MQDKKQLAKKEEQAEITERDPLQDIELSNEKQDELLLETFGESLAERVPILREIIGYTHKYKEKVDSARLAIFLNKVEDKLGSHDAFLGAMARMLTSNAGLTIFQKTTRILNNDNFDEDFIDLLAVTFKNVTAKDFESMFEELNYALSQIEKLSAQALLVLSVYEVWQKTKLQGGTTMSEQTIVGNWEGQMANSYANSIGMTDDRMKKRLAHAFCELENNGIVFLTPEKRVGLTPIGQEVYDLIT